MLDSPWITACLDLGHCGLVGQLPQNMIRALGHDRLGSLHIHDNGYKLDEHNLPYMGKIDWDEVTKALGEIDYTGDFTYEVRLQNLNSSADAKLLSLALDYAAKIGKHLVAKVDQNRPLV